MTPHPTITTWLESCRYLRALPYDQMPRIGDSLCRWCGTPVSGRRRSWCSDDCQQDFMVRWNPGSASSAVYRRDHGVCAICGIDTNEIAALKHQLTSHHGTGYWNADYTEYTEIPPLSKWTPINRRIFNGHDCADVHTEPKAWGPWWRSALWEADHIVPVVEGGGCCGLDNLRTLCIMCHKAETKALAARRAMAKRPQLEFEEAV
jgi:5-methylcytosine-specific restriction enzyme A